jgi:hypothetical protein
VAESFDRLKVVIYFYLFLIYLFLTSSSAFKNLIFFPEELKKFHSGIFVLFFPKNSGWEQTKMFLPGFSQDRAG